MTGIIRLENAALATAGLVAYYLSGAGWLMFALLFLVPDIAFAAYLFGPRIGAFGYNCLHSWIGPALLLALSLLLDWPLALSVGLIWAVHIGADRAIGYGLKYSTGFKDTHLGRIGGG